MKDAAMAKSSIDLDRDSRSIIGTREFDAPRDLVFAAFTDPKHLAQWWGPNGFTTTTSSFEFRAGGMWRNPHTVHRLAMNPYFQPSERWTVGAPGRSGSGRRGGSRCSWPELHPPSGRGFELRELRAWVLPRSY